MKRRITKASKIVSLILCLALLVVALFTIFQNSSLIQISVNWGGRGNFILPPISSLSPTQIAVNWGGRGNFSLPPIPLF